MYGGESDDRVASVCVSRMSIPAVKMKHCSSSYCPTLDRDKQLSRLIVV